MQVQAKTNLAGLDHDQAETARRLLEGAMRSKGITRRELAGALQRGHGYALHCGHPSGWGNEESDRVGNAAGRLLVRLGHELGLPVSGVIGTTALGVAEELLA